MPQSTVNLSDYLPPPSERSIWTFRPPQATIYCSAGHVNLADEPMATIDSARCSHCQRTMPLSYMVNGGSSTASWPPLQQPATDGVWQSIQNDRNEMGRYLLPIRTDYFCCYTCFELLRLYSCEYCNNDFLAHEHHMVGPHHGHQAVLSDSYGDSVFACPSCAEDIYHCEECSEPIPPNDERYDPHSGQYYCSYCIGNRPRSSAYIRDYHSCNKAAKMFGENIERFGIELEVNGDGYSTDCEDAVSSIDSTYNFPDYFLYHEWDSSVGDSGWEIITAPMDYEFWQSTKPEWHGMMEYLRSRGFRSHDSSCCGLHIHVGLPSFGDTATERDANVSKVVWIFEHFWDDILRFSRRTRRQMDSWAARYELSSLDDIDQIVKAKGHGRKYSAVNMSPTNTVEFRVFRGTLKRETFDAAIDFTMGVVKYCTEASFKQVRSAQNLLDVVHKDFRTPELLSYLRVRGIPPYDADLVDDSSQNEGV